MLLEFSVGNYRSFKEIETLQMEAAPIVSKWTKLDAENLVHLNEDLSVLKSKAIYGSNGSGKSNLLKALATMNGILENNIGNSNYIHDSIIPFNLNVENQRKPSFFQIVFLLHSKIYRYGFEVEGNDIISEWLFQRDISEGQSRKKKERYLFTREGMDVSVNNATFSEARHFLKQEKNTNTVFRTNSLVLSVAAAFNNTIAKELINYLLHSFHFSGVEQDSNPYKTVMARLENTEYSEKLIALMQSIDPSISQIVLKKFKEPLVDLGTLPFVQRKYKNGIESHLPLLTSEAEGTKKIFAMSPYIFDAIENGDVLIVDEFDSKLHPKLTRKIIEMFHSSHVNKKGGQLIFVTHDTNLLDNSLMRRDQILFANKGVDGSTQLYSLVEIKGVRNDNSYQKDYLLGKYGAVPVNLNVLEEPFKSYLNAEEDEG